MQMDANIDFWIKNGLNVIFRGKHGVGKTTKVLEAFNSHNLKWQYFSASTMDPWVDFIGIPKEKTEDGKTFLDLIRPKHFAEDDVEAIFLDEYNRAPKKVRNAVMELIQFKSINGKKFKNLKIVWAAINPDDDSEKYDVEPLDPAQMDRFHVVVDVPYLPDMPYFKNKFGAETALAGLTWWKDLTKEERDKVSPRRLDYTLDIHAKGGDIRFVLPEGLNINKLLTELKNGPISSQLEKLHKDNNVEAAKAFISVENNYSACFKHIVGNKDYLSFFVPLLNDERISAAMVKEKKIEDFVLGNEKKFLPVIKTIANTQSHSSHKKAQKIVQKIEEAEARAKAAILTTVDSVFPIERYLTSINGSLKNIPENYPFTQTRAGLYEKLLATFPKEPSLLSINHQEQIMECLGFLLTSSQVATIAMKMPNLIGMIKYMLEKVPSMANHNFKAITNGAFVTKLNQMLTANIDDSDINF